MRIRHLIVAALTASTTLATLPLHAGYSYGTPRFEERDHGYSRDDYRYGDHRHNHGRYAPRLVKLGSVQTYGRDYQNDVFEICDRQRYTAIVFKVDRGDVAVDRIRVTFGDDSSFLPDTKVVFREGDRTCRIDFPGYNREVKRIRIRYQALTRGVSAIDVYGVPAH